MRPVRTIATAVFVAALAVTGCASRTTDQPATPASAAPSSVPTTTPAAAATTRPTAASTPTTTATAVTLANATCAVSPTTGPAGSRVTLTCRRFAPSEPVAITFEATVLATSKASAGGEVTASFAVPSGFAGSHYPGRKDTFQAKSRHSGKAASATFTVTG
jgi:hypothetical protein